MSGGEAWRTAGELRASGRRVPRDIADDQPVRYVPGVDRDGSPLVRIEARPRPVVPETPEHRCLRYALIGMARAIRERYECGSTDGIECGGVCCLPIGHEGAHACAGDKEGPGTCPAG